MSAELTLYADLLKDIKNRVRQAQNRASISANAEMLWMYWDVGRMIAARQKQAGWGTGLLARLTVDLRNEIPKIKGFSERNLQLMTQFQAEYPTLFSIPQRPVAESRPPGNLPTTERHSHEISGVLPDAEIPQLVVAQLRVRDGVRAAKRMRY